MKQTVEKAAKENILFNHRTVDRTLSGEDLAKFGEINFAQGAEWHSRQSPWISVEEKLPKCGDLLIVAYSLFGKIQFGVQKIYDLGDLKDWDYGGEKILAWMPIPPFKEGMT